MRANYLYMCAVASVNNDKSEMIYLGGWKRCTGHPHRWLRGGSVVTPYTTSLSEGEVRRAIRLLNVELIKR